MKKPVAMLVEKVDETGVCKHYWIVDSPNGALSKGICKECGKATEFENSIPEYNTYRDYGSMKKKSPKKEIVEEVEWIPEKIESVE